MQKELIKKPAYSQIWTIFERDCYSQHEKLVIVPNIRLQFADEASVGPLGGSQVADNRALCGGRGPLCPSANQGVAFNNSAPNWNAASTLLSDWCCYFKFRIVWLRIWSSSWFDEFSIEAVLCVLFFSNICCFNDFCDQ